MSTEKENKNIQKDSNSNGEKENINIIDQNNLLLDLYDEDTLNISL